MFLSPRPSAAAATTVLHHANRPPDPRPPTPPWPQPALSKATRFPQCWTAELATLLITPLSLARPRHSAGSSKRWLLVPLLLSSLMPRAAGALARAGSDAAAGGGSEAVAACVSLDHNSIESRSTRQEFREFLFASRLRRQEAYSTRSCRAAPSGDEQPSGSTL